MTTPATPSITIGLRVRCACCPAERGETNHWILAETTAIGDRSLVRFTDWDDQLAAAAATCLDPSSRVRREIVGLCSESCSHKFLSSWLTERRKSVATSASESVPAPIDAAINLDGGNEN